VDDSSTIAECNQPSFTIEQEQRYARRYEEGFDVRDEHYEAWLKVNHPEHTRAGSSNIHYHD